MNIQQKQHSAFHFMWTSKGYKLITLSQWADLGPAGDCALLCVLTDHRLQQEKWQTTQYSKDTVRQEEDTCTKRKTPEIRDAV